MQKSWSSRTCTYSLAFLSVILLASQSSQAAGQLDCTPGSSSTAIDFTRLGGSFGDGFYCGIDDPTKQSCPEGRQTFQIFRAIGNGLVSAGEFGQGPVSNPDGFLLNPSQLVANGLVSSIAKMEFEFISGGEEPASLSVLLNGSNVANLPLRFGSPRRLCVDIPINSLKFGHRTANGTLQTGRNTLVFRLSRKNMGPGGGNGEAYFAMARATQIRFQALSPIMLLHGIGDDGSAFYRRRAATSGQFVESLAQKQVGFAIIKYNPIRIEDGRYLVPGALTQQDVFASDEYHLVAWSKGGLWVRSAIEANPKESQYRTLFTIDTPHDGALGTLGNLLGSGRAFLLAGEDALGTDKFLAQAQDLYPAAVRNSSSKWRKTSHVYESLEGPKKSQYFSIAANADLNGDGIIQPEEANGFLQLVFDNSFAVRQSLRLYNWTVGGFNCALRVDVPGTSLFMRVVNASPLQCGRSEPHDMIVRVSSASNPAFVPLQASSPTQGVFHYNHHTVLNPIIASRILGAILSNEPISK
jgi:hypothetical protein